MKRIVGRFLLTAACVALASFQPAGALADEGLDEEVNGAEVTLEHVRQNHLASVRLEALRSNAPVSEDSSSHSSPSEWLRRVEAGTVNMVTNRVVGAQQKGMNIDGKTYYVPGESYDWTLSNNLSLRYAKDPATGESVDKSEAVIFADASGRAYYFESEDSYRNFISLSEEKTTRYSE